MIYNGRLVWKYYVNEYLFLKNLLWISSKMLFLLEALSILLEKYFTVMYIFTSFLQLEKISPKNMHGMRISTHTGNLFCKKAPNISDNKTCFSTVDTP